MKNILMIIELLGILAGIYILLYGTFYFGLFILIINILGLILNISDNGKKKKG